MTELFQTWLYRLMLTRHYTKETINQVVAARLWLLTRPPQRSQSERTPTDRFLGTALTMSALTGSRWKRENSRVYLQLPLLYNGFFRHRALWKTWCTQIVKMLKHEVNRDKKCWISLSRVHLIPDDVCVLRTEILTVGASWALVNRLNRSLNSNKPLS